jgi:hypothetical protein
MDYYLPVHPLAITNFETLDKRIQLAGGRPIVLEALWEGNITGWYLMLSLYIEPDKRFNIKSNYVQLGTVSFGGDSRLFTGEVPAWPEAELAKEWGHKAATKYGLVFYFPSDKEPDDDCPTWIQKHRAIHCADCNKLIIPTDSPYLPKDICHNCHLTRELNNKIKQNTPADKGGYVYLSNGEWHELQMSCTEYTSLIIYPYVQHYIEQQQTAKSIDRIFIDGHDIVELKVHLNNELEKMLTSYRERVLDDKLKQTSFRFVLDYQGSSYNLRKGEYFDASALIGAIEATEEAILKQHQFEIIIKNDFTYRDNNLLLFIKHTGKGNTSVTAINKQYTDVLTEQEIAITLQKLEQAGCISVQEGNVQITTIGELLR